MPSRSWEDEPFRRLLGNPGLEEQERYLAYRRVRAPRLFSSEQRDRLQRAAEEITTRRTTVRPRAWRSSRKAPSGYLRALRSGTACLGLARESTDGTAHTE